jgi:hypothetical protein
MLVLHECGVQIRLTDRKRLSPSSPTGPFCERVAIFPRRHRLGLRPGPLGLVCHSIFKRNGVRDLAYLHDGSSLAEHESNWRDHVPESKGRPAGCFFRWNLRLPGGVRRYRHNETISTRGSRDAGITIGGTFRSRYFWHPNLLPEGLIKSAAVSQ